MMQKLVFHRAGPTGWFLFQLSFSVHYGKRWNHLEIELNVHNCWFRSSICSESLIGDVRARLMMLRNNRKLSYFVINPTTLPNTAIQAANSLRLLFFLFLLLSKKKHELPANWSSHQRKPWYWYFKFMQRCIFFLLSPCDMRHSGSDTTAGRLSCRATLTLTHHHAASRTLFPFRYHLEMPFVLQMMGV